MDQVLQKALDELKEYCAKYDRIAIYGAGETGNRVSGLLIEQGISFSCFCVTKKKKNSFEGHEVRAVDELDCEDTGIIVAVSERNIRNVLELLNERKISYYYNEAFLSHAYWISCRENALKVKVADGYVVEINSVPFDANTLYIVGTGGIGDTLYTAGFVEPYRREHPEVKRVCMLLRERQRELGTIFPGIDEITISDELVEIAYQYYRYTYDSTGACRFKNYICGQGKGGKTLLERFRTYAMGLTSDVHFAHANLHPNGERAKRQKRTVVLMPYANSLALLSDSFWDKLVCLLKKAGYTVFTNVGSYRGERALAGTESICKGLLETAIFCEGCDAVISLRSGMCDLLAFSSTKLIVLNSTETYFNNWNLRDVFDREGIYNVNCWKDFNCNNIIDQIMSLLSQHTEETAI